MVGPSLEEIGGGEAGAHNVIDIFVGSVEQVTDMLVAFHFVVATVFPAFDVGAQPQNNHEV